MQASRLAVRTGKLHLLASTLRPVSTSAAANSKKKPTTLLDAYEVECIRRRRGERSASELYPTRVRGNREPRVRAPLHARSRRPRAPPHAARPRQQSSSARARHPPRLHAHVAASFTAGLLTAAVSNPVDVVKTRVFLTEKKPEVSEKRVYRISRKIIGFAILISDEI